MNRIYYYVSDHGWGHAARTVAVVRALLDLDPLVAITVDGQAASWLLERSLDGSTRVTFRHTSKDFGLELVPGSLKVDREATRRRLRCWLGEWKEYVRREADYCRKTHQNLIVSDIAPQPFLVAEEAGIPSVAISNFTWYEVYRALYGDTTEVEAIRKAYRKAHLALLLPMTSSNGLFRRTHNVGLVTREITRDRDEVSASVGVERQERVAFLGLGRSVTCGPALGRLDRMTAGVRVLRSAGAEVEPTDILRIPSGETESQDFVAACDVVVTKAGYTSVAEAIAGRVPILVAPREGMVEDQPIIDAVEALAVGKKLPADDLLTSTWHEAALELAGDPETQRRYRNLPARYAKLANDRAAELVLGQLRQKEGAW